MNLFKMSDADRIKALKAVILAMLAGHIVSSYYASLQVKKLVKNYNRNVRKMRVAGQIIDALMKAAPPDVIERVVQQYEFDWVVADIDPDEVRVEDYDDPKL